MLKQLGVIAGPVMQESFASFDPRIQAGFEFAREIAVQLITLSTAFLALTIAFTKELLAGLPARGVSWLHGTWMCHVISILSGVLTLMALTGALMPIAQSGAMPGPTAFTPAVRGFAMVQIVSFFVGMVTLAVYATVSQLRAQRRKGRDRL
jgi:hypothetical protein